MMQGWYYVESWSDLLQILRKQAAFSFAVLCIVVFLYVMPAALLLKTSLCCSLMFRQIEILWSDFPVTNIGSKAPLRYSAVVWRHDPSGKLCKIEASLVLFPWFSEDKFNASIELERWVVYFAKNLKQNETAHSKHVSCGNTSMIVFDSNV